LTTATLPTLEDLRSAPDGAWLWDGALGRIVWANKAGLALFDCTSIFELIDRPFDAREAGVQAVAELTLGLARGERREGLFHFPSVGLVAPLACTCNLHSLADGRAGLLLVETKPQSKPDNVQTDSVVAAFANMPLAAAFVTSDGKITGQNAAAAQLFAALNLTDLLGSTERSEAVLTRLNGSGLVSMVETIRGRVGLREVRLTLQKSDAENSLGALLLLEDVTERRNLERQMEGISPPPKPVENTSAFEALAKTLKDTIQRDSEPAINPALAAPKAIAVAPKIEAVAIPATIRKALELTGNAIIIQQGGKPVFVSTKALDRFECTSEQQLLNDADFWTSLNALAAHEPVSQLTLNQKRKVSMVVKTSKIPWLSGPAVQYVFEPVEQVAHVVAPPPEAAPAPILDDELMHILDIAADGIVTLDRDGKILSFSAGAEAIFGFRTAEVLEKPLSDLLTPESRKQFRNYLSGLEGPGLATVFNDGREMTAIVKQGGTVPIFFTLGKLQSSKIGAAYAAVMRDITTWKRTEKELRDAKESAEEASRQKSEFLARISHELRTPLNAIIGFSEVMRLGQFGELKNDKYRGYVNDIHNSGTYLLSLINDLLDLSKIEAGKMELNFTAVSVVEATDHAMRLLQDTATRGRVLVRKSFADNLPRVVADLRALRQVMLNILSNAIKFTDPGGQIIVSAQVNAKGEFALSVKDTGIGMNAAQLKEALEPFSRIETTGRETLGTGLGLSLTKALVEANRARFEISSETGRGTLIEILFPTTRVLAE
jgi:PAS domain S-box-containing protein